MTTSEILELLGGVIHPAFDKSITELGLVEDVKVEPLKDAVGNDVKVVDKGHFTDTYLEDGSYIKLDNLTIGYNFKFKENKYVDNLRLYLTGQNLFTITSYSGQDPEINTTSVGESGIDYPNFYPRVATVMLGVNLMNLKLLSQVNIIYGLEIWLEIFINLNVAKLKFHY